MNNPAVWTDGAGNLGIPKSDFFLSRTVWKFKIRYICVDNGAVHQANALDSFALLFRRNAIDLNDQGHRYILHPGSNLLD